MCCSQTHVKDKELVAVLGFLCSREVLGAAEPYKAGVNVSKTPAERVPPYVDMPLLSIMFSGMHWGVERLVVCTIWFRPLDGCSCAS